MTRILTLLLATLSINGFSQTFLTEQQYAAQKANGTLPADAMVDPSGTFFTPSKPSSSNAVVKSGCQCYQVPDATYSVASFTGCDDGYMGPIAMPFNFCLYGTNYTSFYINTNGNVTFGSPYTTFTASGFPMNSVSMLAPFWGDVDLCGTGTVYYKVTPDAVYVNWEQVGYYPSQTDKLNTFQLVFSNGSDAFIPGTDNVAFCYLDMQWTTGSASGGSGGFGGTPATVGVNAGNGVDFVQMGRFDQPGTAYDGPFGAADGVSWLDNQSMSFDVCTASGNVPPVFGGLGIPSGGSGNASLFGNCVGGDTIKLCGNDDTLFINPVFYAPEQGETVTITANFGTFTSGSFVSNTSGNPANAVIMLVGDAANAGWHTIQITGTDDGTPSQATTVPFTLYVDPNTTYMNPTITGDSIGCSGDLLTLALDSAFIYDDYVWNYSPYDSTITVDSSNTYFVTVQKNNCYETASIEVTIFDNPQPFLQGNIFTCPNDSTLISINPATSTGLPYDSLDWGIGMDTLTQMYFTTGSHSVTVVDTNGCTGSTNFTITSSASLNVNGTVLTSCNTLTNVFPAGYNTGETGGSWTFNGPAGSNATFSPPTALNPSVTVDTYGDYELIYTDACGEIDTAYMTFAESPNPVLTDTFFCAETFTPYQLDPGVNDPGNSYTYSWNTGDTTQLLTVTDSGTYTISVTNSCGTGTATSQITTVVVSIPSDTSVCGLGYWAPLDDVESPQGGYWTWSSSNSSDTLTFLPDAGTDDVQMFSNNIGVFVVTYTDSLCGIQETMTVEFLPYPYTYIEDDTLCRGTTFELNAEHPYNDSYLWNTMSTDSEITIFADGLYYVTVTNGCGSYTDSAYITMITCDCTIPNIITPNGDGSNDNLEIDCLEFVKNSTLQIFNRWGTPVYTSTNYANNWEGKDMKGDALADGTYFYILHVADTDEYYKGTITIVNNR